MPGDHRGYAREPIELIGLVPVGQRWFDVLRRSSTDPDVLRRPSRDSDERHALAALDPFSEKRFDVYWKYKDNTAFDSEHRRAGASWKEIDDAKGVAMVLPMTDGSPFCAFGDASGYPHDVTKLKEHTFKDTGGNDWGSMSWDHWPVGWLNSQAHNLDAESNAKYPNHFSPAGMDLFALPNEAVEGSVYYSLLGVGPANRDVEPIRQIARAWLECGAPGNPNRVAQLK
jgi:hypothetical protein